MLNLWAHVNIYFSQAWEDERTEGLLIFSALFIFIVGQCLRGKFKTRKMTEKFEWERASERKEQRGNESNLWLEAEREELNVFREQHWERKRDDRRRSSRSPRPLLTSLFGHKNPDYFKSAEDDEIWDVSGMPDTIKNTVWNQTFMADGGWGKVAALIPGIVSE